MMLRIIRRLNKIRREAQGELDWGPAERNAHDRIREREY